MREPGGVAGGTGDDVGGFGRGGEQAAFDGDVGDAGGPVAADQPGGEGGGDPGGGLGIAAVYPDARVDAPHAVEEQHGARQPGGRVWVDGVPLGGGDFQVEVEFGAGLFQGAAV